MYEWRKLSEAQRRELLKQRRAKGFPDHSPPHFLQVEGYYLFTAACYEHKPIIGKSTSRMQQFCMDLLDTLERITIEISAWCVLPNHYHVLIKINDSKSFMNDLGKLHGRTSFEWNGEEGCRGRKVWFNASDRLTTIWFVIIRLTENSLVRVIPVWCSAGISWF